MTTTDPRLTADRTISIFLMVLGGLGTLIWAVPSIMLVMISDSGMHGVAWLSYLFLFVAWFAPAVCTIVAIVWGIIRLKRRELGTWWRLLIVLLAAPVAIVILGAILSVVTSSH